LDEKLAPYFGDPRNEEFRSLMKAWIAEAINALEGKAPPKTAAVEVALALEDDGTYGGHHLNSGGPDRPSFDLLLDALSDHIWNKPSLNHLLDFVEQTDEVRSYLGVYDDVDWATTKEDSPRWNPYALYLCPFLALYLRWVAEGNDGDTAFAHLYHHLEALVYGRETIDVHALYLFRNFGTIAAPFDIGDGLMLRTARPDEQARLIRSQSQWRFQPVWRTVTPHSVVHRSYRLSDFRPGLTKSVRGEGRGTAARLEYALRLIDHPFVAAGAVEWTSDNPLLPLPSEPQWHLGTEATSGIPDLHDDRGVFVVDERLAISLREAWGLTARAVEDRRFEVARKRLEHSVAEAAPEDRLIDEWIALEALFLKDGEPSEMSYRVCLRIARELGDTADEREEIRQTLNKSYNHRSKGGVHGAAIAVHGAKPARIQDLAEKERYTAKILRRAIRYCLERQDVPDIASIEKRFLA
jgi:hypothetical protein